MASGDLSVLLRIKSILDSGAWRSLAALGSRGFDYVRSLDRRLTPRIRWSRPSIEVLLFPKQCPRC